MPRAVHRLQPVDLVVVERDQEHVLAELLPVARRDPERLVVDKRRLHLDIAAARVLAASKRLELVPDRHPVRVPERRPRRVLVEVEEVEPLAEHAVVALARLLEPLQMRVEILLRVEGGAVDPRQLRLRRVAAPVRAGEPRQLQRLDRLRVLEVRAAAQIGEVPLRVQADLSFRRVDQLDSRLAALEKRPAPPVPDTDAINSALSALTRRVDQLDTAGKPDFGPIVCYAPCNKRTTVQMCRTDGHSSKGAVK